MLAKSGSAISYVPIKPITRFDPEDYGHSDDWSDFGFDPDPEDDGDAAWHGSIAARARSV
jgi:hypothetical protein